MKTLSQNQISKICENLFEDLPKLFGAFGVEYIEYPNRYSFACPVHGGDNPEGCSIFTDGTSSKGNWQCWTHHCEEEYTNNLFGFVRGMVSEQRSKKISLNETAAFCTQFLDTTLDRLDVPTSRPNEDLKILEIFKRCIQRESLGISRDEIRSKISIPSSYYIERGFKSETLDVFDVGLCEEKYKPMSGRVVVPIYDEHYGYVGCVGRSIVPDMKPKWLHSTGFKKNVLYGLNIAHKYILETQSVILVEGQGDVWRMHEAGYKNCVGIFGSSINDEQLLLLEQSGALNLIILTDSDDAGNKAHLQIMKKCGRRFNYHRPEISTKDVGEMPIEQLQTELFPQLEGMI
jgi:5S rRNA maturation endonuclease (ribonuclease M5)